MVCNSTPCIGGDMKPLNILGLDSAKLLHTYLFKYIASVSFACSESTLPPGLGAKEIDG